MAALRTVRELKVALSAAEDRLVSLLDDVWNQRELIRVLKRELKKREAHDHPCR